MLKKTLILLGVAIMLLLFFGTVGQLVGAYVFMKYGPVSNESLAINMLYKYHLLSDGTIFGYNTAYKVAVVLSGIIAVVPVVILIAAIFVKPKRELHGSARFATKAEITQSGLLKAKHEEPDLLIGQYQGSYLRWAGKQFAFLAAPTRSGKGVGIVIPNCLHYRDSLVVFDPKLENFNITAGFRAAHGQDVFLFNPSTKDFKSHCWNPISYVSRDPFFSTGGAFNIANILYATGGNDNGNSRFFYEMAQKLFVGLCLYLIETEKARA